MNIATVPPAEHAGYWEETKVGFDGLAEVCWPSMKAGLTAGLMTIGILRLFNWRWLNRHRDNINIFLPYTAAIAGAVVGVIKNSDQSAEEEREVRELEKALIEKLGGNPRCYINKKICFVPEDEAVDRQVPSEIVLDKEPFVNEKFAVKIGHTIVSNTQSHKPLYGYNPYG